MNLPYLVAPCRLALVPTGDGVAPALTDMAGPWRVLAVVKALTES